MKIRTGGALFFLALLAGACAGPSAQIPVAAAIPVVGSEELATEQGRQLTFQVETRVAQLTRISNVSHRIFVANASYCAPNTAPRLGLISWTTQDVSAAYRDAAIGSLKLEESRRTVVAVVAGGPGAAAGIAGGDVLVSVDGETIPSGSQGAIWLDSHLKARTGPVRLEVERKGKVQSRKIVPVDACANPVILVAAGTPNAITDGKRIALSTGLLRIAETDAELAIVIGHELAHIVMGHIAKRKTFARGSPSSDLEREADYIGAYFVARAGYDPTGAEKLWRTIAQENPRQIFAAGVHPTTPERFLIIQKANQEIAEKKRKHLPLEPEMKADQAIETQTPTQTAGRPD
jgi:membrane-associated protease RseP (regulator of RpoE activity)